MKNKKIGKALDTTIHQHKVTLNSISQLNNFGYYYFNSPSGALEYLCKKFDGQIKVVKHKIKSITILICCENTVYESLKLDFIRNMGDSFIWKD